MSRREPARREPRPDRAFDHFDACASDSDNRDSKELDVESDTNDIRSASARSDDLDECRGFDGSEKFNFNYARAERSDRSYDNVGGYSFPSVYPEYLVPRTFCKESGEDAPCDLSNWQRSLKFDQGSSSRDADAAGAPDAERAPLAPDAPEVSDAPDASDAPDGTDQTDQPINFAYYHF